MNWSVAGRPWPPYSFGQPMPSQPSAPICLTMRAPALAALAPVPDVGPDLGGQQLGEVGPQLLAQRLLLVGLLEVHLRPLQLSERDILVGSGFAG